MEILTLMGTPPIVADVNSAERATTLFSVSAVTHAFSGSLVDQPGQPFNTLASPLASTGWCPFASQLTLSANTPTFKDDTWDRLVMGFRMVNKGGWKGLNGQNPYLQTIAVQKPAGGNSLLTVPAPLAPHLNGDDGQYIEVVIDFKTGTFEFYFDGGYVATTKFPALQGLDPTLYGVGFRIYADQTQIPYAAAPIVGHYRDLYLGGLALGEEFEPLGDLKVSSLPTVSSTLSAGFLSGSADSWGGGWSVSTSLDSASANLRTQTFADPTPLKTAFAISGICPRLTAPGYIEASSNGAKIAGDTPIRGRATTRILQIKPTDIGNDLVISFKIDP